jgi:hypothetical protein
MLIVKKRVEIMEKWVQVQNNLVDFVECFPPQRFFSWKSYTEERVLKGSQVSECYHYSKSLSGCAKSVWKSNYRRLQDFTQDVFLVSIKEKEGYGKVYAYVLYCSYHFIDEKNRDKSKEIEVRAYFSVPIHWWEQDLVQYKDILRSRMRQFVEDKYPEIENWRCEEDKNLKEGFLRIYIQNSPDELISVWCNGWERAPLSMAIYLEIYDITLDKVYSTELGYSFMDLIRW